MAVPFSNTKLRVPKGFQNILEAFAKEVLRQQPANIYEFGAVFFEEMVKERESRLLLKFEILHLELFLQHAVQVHVYIYFI